MILDPTPEAIATARLRAGHTQAQAAAAVGVQDRAWQRWESGDAAMPSAAWWLYLLRVGRVSLSDLPAIPERQRAAVRAELMQPLPTLDLIPVEMRPPKLRAR